MSLAQWSNLFVYASMAMYALAFIAFAVSFAATRPSPDAAPVEGAVASEPAAVSAGAGATAGAVTTADAAARARAEARARSAQLEAEMAAEARRSRWGGGGAPGGSDEALAPGRRAANIGMSLTWLATGLLLAGLVARGLWSGRAPWGNMYEYSLASALAISGVFLAFSLRRDVRWLGLLVSAASLITLGIAVLLLYNDSPQLVPALHSYWLIIHVSAAIISGGAFTVGAAATVLYLIADRAERVPGARISRSIAARIPDATTLDTLAYRTNAFVFPLWTFAVIAGAIWAEDAWGRYWGWDPKETWAFITWLVYAGYLHARATAGWRGRKAAVIGLIGFASFLINYFGVNLFAGGLHSYAGL
ncbi:MAG: c-type cytochrome biogenesis protein CcsB [Candidatus Nanopelagicales bacterium]|nr:c-type cytochrome biogenesis protein CcsB [Candidatus Nanopelagicales bacterium]